jgi:hypothetical protein
MMIHRAEVAAPDEKERGPVARSNLKPAKRLDLLESFANAFRYLGRTLRGSNERIFGPGRGSARGAGGEAFYQAIRICAAKIIRGINPGPANTLPLHFSKLLNMKPSWKDAHARFQTIV